MRLARAGCDIENRHSRGVDRVRLSDEQDEDHVLDQWSESTPNPDFLLMADSEQFYLTTTMLPR